MKKNRMMRLASMLLVAVMMTTCTISGTFAKYVTSDKGTDTARVAKFGVEVTGDSDIFDADYTKVDGDFASTLSVQASAGDRDNLVAPGTTKTMANVKITGTPEVAVRVSNKVNKFDVGENWVVAGDFYCPLIFTVVDATGTTYYVSGLDFDNPADFEAEVIEKIETATKDYAPLTDLGTLANDQILEITWEWAFEGATVDTELSYGQTDEKDTALGDKAVAEDIKVEIDVTTTVTQID